MVDIAELLNKQTLNPDKVAWIKMTPDYLLLSSPVIPVV
jgi:hypothetical protein